MREISSPQNQLVKEILELKAKASKRKATGLCVIEGEKELDVALEAGIKIEKILIDHDCIEKYEVRFKQDPIDIYLASDSVLEKIAIRDTKQKVIAVAKTKTYGLDDVRLSSCPFVLILENVEKPGNIGALLRTADAANVDLVLCVNMQTDIYNPNVIRNSLGCVFTKQIVSCSHEEAKQFCLKNNIQIVGTFLHTSQYYYECKLAKPTAILFGTESTGISPYWQKEADILVKIPMLGTIDSMNVSNSASILLYEVVRQRMVN